MLYRTLMKIWLLPPLLNIVLIVFGLVLLQRYRRWGIASCAAGLLSLLLMSMPQVSNTMLKSIEVAEALQLEQDAWRSAGAIVVLGAGHKEFAAEYGDAQPTEDAVARLSYAAYLHQQTGLPILLTGGKPTHSEHVHAEVMLRYLQRHYGIAAQWVELTSRTTWENAENAAAILRTQNIQTVVLVTQSLHMRRSLQLFDAAGFTAIAAPTQLSFDSSPAAQAWRWIPSAQWLNLSSMVMHEMLGYWWYQLRKPQL